MGDRQPSGRCSGRMLRSSGFHDRGRLGQLLRPSKVGYVKRLQDAGAEVSVFPNYSSCHFLFVSAPDIFRPSRVWGGRNIPIDLQDYLHCFPVLHPIVTEPIRTSVVMIKERVEVRPVSIPAVNPSIHLNNVNIF